MAEQAAHLCPDCGADALLIVDRLVPKPRTPWECLRRHTAAQEWMPHEQCDRCGWIARSVAAHHLARTAGLNQFSALGLAWAVPLGLVYDAPVSAVGWLAIAAACQVVALRHRKLMVAAMYRTARRPGPAGSGPRGDGGQPVEPLAPVIPLRRRPRSGGSGLGRAA